MHLSSLLLVFNELLVFLGDYFLYLLASCFAECEYETTETFAPCLGQRNQTMRAESESCAIGI
jgi:hypothetical protein